ncbi:unnamed protein product [Coffea canephora]|uniref:DYW domain-containing protein n=1 Tax=Coffea canephora TaxID=49390 RepID=A0A068TX68_COFCA|nr:unnamed protein product [Coffea canephora]
MGLPSIALPTKLTVITTVTATSTPELQRKNHKPLNSTFKSLSKSGKLDEALQLIEFQQFRNLEVESCTTFLHACISTKSLQHGQRLYKHLPSTLLSSPIVKSKFITLFSVCGQLDEARRIFQHGFRIDDLPDSVWVAMGIGYSRNGLSKEALLLYCEMVSRGIKPGNFALSVAVKACSDLLELRVGRAVHGQIIKAKNEPDQVVYNSLLRLYTKCGCFDEVLKVFEGMPQRNVVSWNSIIMGFVKRENVFEALETFRKMQRVGVGFSWVSLTTILPVCARVTSTYCGKEIHAQIVKSSKMPDVLVLNSLIDMYAKCGLVEYCRRVFDRIEYKDLTSWNTMLNGYAINGDMEKAITLFNEMIGRGICPDEVTWVALLSGCSHRGLVDQGKVLFERMVTEFHIHPNLEHYACLVDLLGRAGRIEEALEIVKSMPVKPSGSIWGSLLNACRIHGKISPVDFIAKELLEIEPDNPGNYVMLSNIYANAGMWKGVNKMREMMEKRGIKKEAGCSWMYVKNRIHTFVAGGGFEFRNSEVYKKVHDELVKALEDVGYRPDTRVVLHDVGEDLKAELVCGHSEKIATIFGLINCGSAMPIRITKNLRVCADCHSWMKYVSKATSRKIILRDTNRFHHFDKGTCSCNDYW